MEVDIDGNGTIEFGEFIDLMRNKSLEVDEEADLRMAFKMFDSNGDGFIDMKELKTVTLMLGGSGLTQCRAQQATLIQI